MQGSAYNVGLPAQQTTSISPTIGNVQGSIGDLSSTYSNFGGSILPQAQTTAQNLYYNPYAAQMQAGAGQAAQMGTGAAQAQFGTGASMIPYAQQVMQTAMDPQQALYNRTLQQTMDQQNAQMAQAGVGTTPYGQGLQAQNLANFNMDWQNQQLQRQLSGLSGAGSAYQTATGLMAQAPTTMSQSAAIPYATYSDIGTGQNQALSQLLGLGSSGANLQNLPISDYLSLLSGQNQANQVANQTAQLGLNQSQLGWGQMAQLGQGLGSAVGWLGGSGPQNLASNMGSFGSWMGL